MAVRGGGMKKSTIYSDKYRGIAYSVSNRYVDGIGEYWTYYLHIGLVQLPEDVREKFWLEPKVTEYKSMPISYDYYKEPLIADLDWHGGVTWYSKEAGIDGEPRVVKIGCDYQHLWDEGHSYQLTDVERDARHTIDTLHDMIPGMLKWCQGCGDYFKAENDERWCPVCDVKYNKEEE